MLQPHVFPDHETMSRFAADRLAARLNEKPNSLICLATGTTPTRTYELLAQKRGAVPRLFERVRVIKLDEWGGLAMSDPATCEQYLRQYFVDVLGLADRYVGFHSHPADPENECRRIRGWLEDNGPIDICVLGLGLNGHLGFNEPAPALKPHAHIARLSASSLGHSMLERAAGRPTYGLTLGMADLMHSRQIILLLSGPAKQGPLRRLLHDPISMDFPASLLQLHPRVSLLSDSTAMSAEDLGSPRADHSSTGLGLWANQG
jgi:galactosamine-6-phosphate isomerase